MSKDTARKILDDLFRNGPKAIEEYDRPFNYCNACGATAHGSTAKVAKISHEDTCPYVRYRRMVEEEK